MIIGQLEINIKLKRHTYFDTLFRQFLDNLVRYFGESICGWWLLNKAYGIDNKIVYFIKFGELDEKSH